MTSDAHAALLIEIDDQRRELAEIRRRIEAFGDVVLLESVFAEAVEAIGARERAARWMLTSARSLAGQTPIDALAVGGEAQVRRLLSVIAFGGVA